VTSKEYSKEITERLKDGTERTLYPAICNFLAVYTKDAHKKDIAAVAEQSSKNYEKGVGFPDITIKEKGFSLGYIEVKLPTDSLDDKRFKEQFDRYKASLENIIFTNLKIWQLWQWDKDGNAKKVKEIIFDYADPKTEDFAKIFELFISFTPVQASTPKQLAINLAKRTKLLASLLTELLEDETQNKLLKETKEAFKNALLHDIDDKSFTNLIAETFTYSLFIATLEHFESGKQDDLTLTTAADYIPHTIPVLHDLYSLAQNLGKQIVDIRESVELVLKELNCCAIEKIRNSFYKEGSTQEPMLYFYETFLREYDKETKKKRGAYYTPKPVVDFIVRSVDAILIENFGLKDGFMNPEVKLLDPATGTGTFLASTIELVKSKIDKKYTALNVEKEQFVKEISNHILHNFYGFEFMIAPYTVAHLKLTLLLKTLGFDFEMTKNDGDPDNDRFKIYLANTLDDPSKEPNSLFGFSHISEESKKAKAVKNQRDIIAIIGNPPYSGSSQNPSMDENKKRTWIGAQIESYKYDGTKKLDEKNPKWLQDDYVKFIRFAQYQIDTKGSGVIGYIVPHGFLDNPTFRYMRKSLMGSFSKIYILDLHGNDNKKEVAGDGSKDENVFAIKQGVAIVLLVKEPKKTACEVYHGEIYGKQEEKFHTLETSDFKKLCATKLSPSGEMSYFIPRTADGGYEKFWSVKDIFRENTIAIATHRDGVAYHETKKSLEKLLSDFDTLAEDTVREKYKIAADSRDWQLAYAQNTIKTFGIKDDYFANVIYRPFEHKWTYYVNKSKSLLGYPRYEVMRHMLQSNFCLIINRTTKREIFNTVFFSNTLVDLHVMETGSASAYVFPLYLYNEDKTSLLDDEKTTNFTDDFKAFQTEYLAGFSDEQIFYYIYGLLHSPTYRTRYNEFLKTDFPRIDFGYDIAKISQYGEELARLHLLAHEVFDESDKWGLKVEGKDYGVSFARKADIYKDNKIYLNEKTYIEGITKEVFAFTIGGYQVCDKWLSDRKNTTLTIDELMHYMKIIVSLRETIRVMGEIDEVVNNEL
jgi:predicted helicase